jgi:hypothetical protein
MSNVHAVSRLCFLPVVTVVCLAAAGVAAAPPPYFSEIGKTLQGYYPGQAGLASGDFDGDGRMDLVLSGSFAPYPDPTGWIVQVLGETPGGIGLKQTLASWSWQLNRILAWTGADERPHLLGVDDAGQAVEWSGWPLQVVRTFPLHPDVQAAAIGDVDNDGRLELVTLQSSAAEGIAARDLTTGNLEWTLPDYHSGLALAQLDGDPAMEIVVGAWGSQPGIVIDGATRATEWSFPAGFGEYVVAGLLLEGGSPGFAAANAWGYFGVFQGTPWTAIWRQWFDRETSALAVADIDGDGRDEVIRADGQWGSVHIHDSLTGLLRLSIPNPAHGVGSVTSVDFHGVEQPLVAFTPITLFSPTDPLLELASPIDGSAVWSLSYLPPSYAPVLAYRRRDDGKLLLVHTTGGSHPTTRIIDLHSGEERWRSLLQPPAEPMFLPAHYLVATRPDGHENLIVAGSYAYTGKIVALDSTSYDPQWEAGGPDDPDINGREINGTVLFDFDGDSVDDVVVCAASSSHGARLLAYSGADGSKLWRSITIGSGAGCHGLMAGEFAGNHEIVALVSGSLYAFNRDTQLLDWILPTDGTEAYLVAGIDGPELAVASNETLRFYRADDRLLLRSFEVDGPVDHLQQLDGDIRSLLVATTADLHLLDGTTGEVRATTRLFGGTTTQYDTSPTFSAIPEGSGTYLVGAATMDGIWRFRLTLTDAIFKGYFDPGT